MIKSSDFSLADLRSEILENANSLGVQPSFSDNISKSVVECVEKYLETHPLVTPTDLDLLVVRELKKFHPDLAYIYHNRDKII